MRKPFSQAVAPETPGRYSFLQDLSSSPVERFVESLRNAFVKGKNNSRKGGTRRFVELQKKLTTALQRTSPPPGPCTFIAHCMETLVGDEAPTSGARAEPLEHLLTLSLDDLDDSFKLAEDVSCSRKVVGKLFREAVTGEARIEERVLVKLVLVFGLQLSDASESEATQLVEAFILRLLKDRSYNCAVSLLKHFGLEECTSENLIVSMVAQNQCDLAAAWANHLGRSSCVFLVQQLNEKHLFKIVFRLVKRFDLHQEFPDAFHTYRRSSLEKLVRKGIWDIAEGMCGIDRVLQEHLIVLALRRGLQTRARVLCENFNITDFDLNSVAVEPMDEDEVKYLPLTSVIESENIFWIDDSERLKLASTSLCASPVVGFDCEWKAVRIKGEEPKVSTLQLACREKVFVLDLLRLSEEAPEPLNQCIESIFCSPEIIKLGYAMHNDLELLSQSYPQLQSLNSCRLLLDLESFPDKIVSGGLSGLAKATLGNSLDKSMRMSDWSQRPLTEEQLHYAALDAVVLVLIHEKLCSTYSIPDLGRSYARSWNLSQRKQKNTLETDQKLKNRVDTNEKNQNTINTDQKLKNPVYINEKNQNPIGTAKKAQSSIDTEMLDSLELEKLESLNHLKLKQELHSRAIAAGFKAPVYDTISYGPDDHKRYMCSVRVAGKSFSGKPVLKKRESECLAAQLALEFLQDSTPAEN